MKRLYVAFGIFSTVAAWYNVAAADGEVSAEEIVELLRAIAAQLGQGNKLDIRVEAPPS